MAIYHLSVKSVSRGQGRRATAAAAYRAAERVHDEELGLDYDYTRKRGVEHSEIVLSTAAAKQDIQWARDRQQLWNAAEAAEKRKDARIAREYEIALPAEMNAAQRLQLTRSFAQELASRYSNAVDFAIHAPHWKGDGRNFHAHLLTTTREITPQGLGDKTAVELSNTDREKRGLQSASAEMTEIRGRWKDLTNEHLQSLGLNARVDHRSLEAQGIDRAPTTHLGPAVHGMHRRGVETEVGFRIAEQARERLQRAQELGQLEREAEQLFKSVLILDLRIRDAVSLRDAQLARDLAAMERKGRESEAPAKRFDPELVRQQARERWQEYRAGLELDIRKDQGQTYGPQKELILDVGGAGQPDRERPQHGARQEQDLSL